MKIILGALVLLLAITARADDEWRPSSRSGDEVAASPKEGWTDEMLKGKAEEEEPSDLRVALLWLPNRMLDLWDTFRVDLGVGPAVGGVVRLTKYGQVGYRAVAPLSVRVGDFGRAPPVLLERSSELGVSPAYLESKDREVCAGEVGLGLDLFVVGGYAGVCFDEFIDFVGGVFTLDPKKDDLR